MEYRENFQLSLALKGDECEMNKRLNKFRIKIKKGKMKNRSFLIIPEKDASQTPKSNLEETRKLRITIVNKIPDLIQFKFLYLMRDKGMIMVRIIK